MLYNKALYYHICNDEVNACVATIPMFFEFFDIDEPEDIDFKEE